ncbi:MAG: DNA primase, partial [Patescibacteria group bacterium]
MAKDIDLIKERIDLVDLLRSYITLHPAGKNFKALCPFHQEKTPSFIASPERKRWHCFGCGEDGDIVTFVMKYENLEFPEALRVLAEKAGIELQSVNPALQKEYGLLYGLHDDATAFYKEALLKNENARAYLESRGLTEETIADFNLGFAPGGDSLTLHLIKKGYDVLDIARAGLAYKTARGLYRDRFNQRIMFPIANHLGKVVAFTGRIMPEAEASADPNSIDAAKYVNSPETPIFNKSKIFYGLNASKGAIAKSRTATLVEGQMDFLMMWQTGVKNAVAVSGTGLTPHH